MQQTNSKSGSSLPLRAVALVVLLIAAYILFKVVIGVVTALVVPILAIVAIVAIFWAWRTIT